VMNGNFVGLRTLYGRNQGERLQEYLLRYLMMSSVSGLHGERHG
jgi:hypothetical protein